MTVKRPNLKRVFDVAVTAPILFLSLPVQAVVAALVATRLGRPVFFRQERPGLGGATFTMCKFRTMLPVDPAKGHSDDASRMTSLGTFLRATSLDELPTLWHVVHGDMSLVGPRPLLVSYLQRYSSHQARRHEVRPGLTGLAQVSGRNSLSWEERFDLDVEYVDTRSLALDLKIIVRTVSKVLRREGISAHGAATMPEFMGRGSELMGRTGNNASTKKDISA